MLDLIVDRRELKDVDHARAALRRRRRARRRTPPVAAEPQPVAVRASSDLTSLDPLDFLFSLERLGMKFGLENIAALCAALDHPERAFRSIIVAGTNGKGSVTAMVDAALRAAGHRTGALHLAASRPARGAVRHRRTRGDDRPTCDDAGGRGPGRRRAAAGRRRARRAADLLRVRDGHRLRAVPPTRGVEIAVLEVGLGGRLDATNVVTADGGRHHVDRLRSPGAPRRHARVDRAREGRRHQAGDSGRRADRCRPRPTRVIATRARERGARMVDAPRTSCASTARGDGAI